MTKASLKLLNGYFSIILEQTSSQNNFVHPFLFFIAVKIINMTSILVRWVHGNYLFQLDTKIFC